MTEKNKPSKNDKLQIRNSTVDFLVFTRDAGEDGIEVRVQDHDVWLTQKAIGQLFDVDRSVVTKHLKNIFESGELDEDSTCANFAQIADNGKTYQYKFYSRAFSMANSIYGKGSFGCRDLWQMGAGAMSRADNLAWLIVELERERGLGGKPTPSDDEHELFDRFRALVNTRPPVPASDEFLVLQDRVLRDMLEEAGITDASSLPRVPLDGHISLWRGNITTLRVDAIVNAANSQMLGCWVPGHYCIDNAIHAFAGVQLRLECAKLMEEQGHPEPTGMAKVIDAFNLPALYIIHTVGPIADGSPTELDKQLLANCYESCLEAAEKSGCESIAFCCISTGVFGFPQEAAAMIAIDTVRCWLDKRGSNMHVIFNVFKPEDERIYHEFLFDAER